MSPERRTSGGRLVFRYADEIFVLGQDLMDAVKQRPTGKPLRLVVGVDSAKLLRMLLRFGRLPEADRTVLAAGFGIPVLDRPACVQTILVVPKDFRYPGRKRVNA